VSHLSHVAAAQNKLIPDVKRNSPRQHYFHERLKAGGGEKGILRSADIAK
jgi:hypothetical protein